MSGSRGALTIALALVAGACAGGSRTATPAFYPAPDSSLRSLPFSEAVRVGDLLYLSGQIGVAPGSLTLVPGGLEPEATQALANIKGVLERHGASLDRVVKCTVFLADIRDWPAFNTIYRQAFHAPYPARSAFAASGLALGARVEIDCIAAVR